MNALSHPSQTAIDSRRCTGARMQDWRRALEIMGCCQVVTFAGACVIARFAGISPGAGRDLASAFLIALCTIGALRRALEVAGVDGVAPKRAQPAATADAADGAAVDADGDRGAGSHLRTPERQGSIANCLQVLSALLAIVQGSYMLFANWALAAVWMAASMAQVALSAARARRDLTTMPNRPLVGLLPAAVCLTLCAMYPTSSNFVFLTAHVLGLAASAMWAGL